MTDTSVEVKETACQVCGILGSDHPASCANSHKVCGVCFTAYSFAFIRMGADVVCPDFDCSSALKCDGASRTKDSKCVPAVKLIIVKPSEDEYKEIEAMFMKSMKSMGAVIEKVFRIENNALRGIYEACRERLKKQRGDANERKLFHGTTRAASGGIAREGFDLRRCGSVNGAVYGPGVYYAVDARMSHAYTKEDSKADRCMLVCNVILGDSKKGDSYDGTTFFVVNREQQLLPTHVIYYHL